MRFCLAFLVLALALSGSALAQNRVRTETIRPPAAAPPPAFEPAPPSTPTSKFKADAHVAAPPRSGGGKPEIITDPAQLPAPVARARTRILAAARTGDLMKLFELMQSTNPMPVFSFSEDKDPIAFWKANYPDSDGVEILSILVT